MLKLIKAIIFDIGGVCCTGAMEPAFQKLSQEFDFKEITNFYYQYEKEMLKGNVRAKDFCNLLSEKTNIKSEEIHNTIIQVWKNFFPVNEELVDLIKKLSNNYVVACLSNATEFDTENDRIHGFEDIFNPYLNSCDYGLIKPDKAFFYLALEQLELKADQCLFIDDNKSNIAVAKDIDFKAIQYSSNEQLKKELTKLGVKYDCYKK